MSTTSPEDKEWDEDEEWAWISDPEGLALTEQWIREEQKKALRTLEELFGPEEAKQFVERELGSTEAEDPWGRTPESRAHSALARIRLSPSLRKRIDEIVDKIIDPNKSEDE